MRGEAGTLSSQTRVWFYWKRLTHLIGNYSEGTSLRVVKGKVQFLLAHREKKNHHNVICKVLKGFMINTSDSTI